MCTSSRQGVPTKKRTCYFTLERVPPDQDVLNQKTPIWFHRTLTTYSIFLYSFIFFPRSFIIQLTDVCARAFAFFKLNGQQYVFINIQWRWDGGNTGSTKITFSPLTVCSFNSYLYIPVLFCSLFNLKKNIKILAYFVPLENFNVFHLSL